MDKVVPLHRSSNDLCVYLISVIYHYFIIISKINLNFNISNVDKCLTNDSSSNCKYSRLINLMHTYSLYFKLKLNIFINDKIRNFIFHIHI